MPHFSLTTDYAIYTFSFYRVLISNDYLGFRVTYWRLVRRDVSFYELDPFNFTIMFFSVIYSLHMFD